MPDYSIKRQRNVPYPERAFIVTPQTTKIPYVVRATDIAEALQKFESTFYSLAEGFSVIPARGE
jgi:hypothetical protein